MILRHADNARQHGRYCQARCALCRAAAYMTLAGHKHEASQILNMTPASVVDATAQSNVVTRFLANAGVEVGDVNNNGAALGVNPSR